MLHFPNDIWLVIANHLDSPADVCTNQDEKVYKHNRVVQQALVNLCLVSKQLRAIFQPRLYRSFIKYSRSCARHRLLKFDSEWLHKYYQRDERTFRVTRKESRLENFILTLIRRPDLAVMIKQLRIGSFNLNNALPSSFQKLYEKLPLDEATSGAFLAAVKDFKGSERLPPGFRGFWKKHLKDGDESAEIALLLTLLPCLQSARLETRDMGGFVQALCSVNLEPDPSSWVIKSGHGILFKQEVESASRSQQLPLVLPALESLSVQSLGGYNNLEGLLQLPSLTSFSARSLERYPNIHFWRSEVTFTSLRHLQLEHCQLTGSYESILKRCRRLQSLDINTSFAYSNAEIPPVILGDKLSDALQNVTDTLEHLTLMMPECAIQTSVDLKSFEKLRYLEIDANLLPADFHEALPTSVEEVIIRQATSLINPHLDILLDTFTPTAEFPKLSALKLYIKENEHGDPEKELVSVQKRAREYNLSFEFEDEPAENCWRFWWGDSDSEPDSNGIDSDSDGSDSSG